MLNVERIQNILDNHAALGDSGACYTLADRLEEAMGALRRVDRWVASNCCAGASQAARLRGFAIHNREVGRLQNALYEEERSNATLAQVIRHAEHFGWRTLGEV